MSNAHYELNIDELESVNGGNVTVVAEKGYVGIEISVGSYGIAVWATQGSICGAVNYPGHRGGTCVPS